MICLIFVLIFIVILIATWLLLMLNNTFKTKALELYSKLIKKSVEYQNKQKQQLNKSKRKRSK